MLTQVVFLIAVSFGASAPAPSQATTAPCQALMATMDLFKYGNRWLAWSELERLIYLTGFVDGTSVYAEFMFEQPERVRNAVFDKNSVKYDSDVLSPVITSLYQDPANVFVRHESMIFIARDKISGKDIEPMLRTARRVDCGGNLKK